MSQETEPVSAFVLMPFDPEFDVIFNDLIRPALEEAGYDVKRADSMLNQQNILKDVLRGIAEADLIVADLTSSNANVFYELGISHTMQKRTVLLTQSMEDIPFDLRSYRVIQYSTHFNEAPRLSQELKDIGKKAKSGELIFGNPVDDFVPETKQVASPSATEAAKLTIGAGSKAEAETEEEEKGLWDFVVDGEESLKDMTECMGRITEATQEFGERMQQRGEEAQRIAQSQGAGTASRMHKLAATVAVDINGYAEKIEEEQPRLHNAWVSFDQNTTGLVKIARIRTEQDKEGVLKLRSSIDHLQSGVRNALDATQRYQETIASMKGISKDVNRASRRMARVTDLLISDLEVADSYCTKALTLLGEKLEKEANRL